MVTAALLMTEDIREGRTIHTETPWITHTEQLCLPPYSTEMEPLLPGTDSPLPALSIDTRCYRTTSEFWLCTFLAGTWTEAKISSSLNCTFETD